jgi:hypothetical protein
LWSEDSTAYARTYPATYAGTNEFRTNLCRTSHRRSEQADISRLHTDALEGVNTECSNGTHVAYGTSHILQCRASDFTPLWDIRDIGRRTVKVTLYTSSQLAGA